MRNPAVGNRAGHTGPPLPDERCLESSARRLKGHIPGDRSRGSGLLLLGREGGHNDFAAQVTGVEGQATGVFTDSSIVTRM